MAISFFSFYKFTRETGARNVRRCRTRHIKSGGASSLNATTRLDVAATGRPICSVGATLSRQPLVLASARRAVWTSQHPAPTRPSALGAAAAAVKKRKRLCYRHSPRRPSPTSVNTFLSPETLDRIVVVVVFGPQHPRKVIFPQKSCHQWATSFFVFLFLRGFLI